ncbi:MAG TPA: ornithine carbamoyltransferase [Gemmatimonadota bacterium]
MPKDFLSAADLDAAAWRRMLALARELRGDGDRRDLAGRTLAMIFEKPSLRTRVTFELAIAQLGGRAVHLAGGEIGLGSRESTADVARNLERWVDAIAARTVSDATVRELAANCRIPVVNALTDREHPCQAAADFLTILDRRGSLDGLRLAWVGDGNNVCHSLILAAARLGVGVRVAAPRGYEPDPAVLAGAERIAEPGYSAVVVREPADAVAGAHAVYTDVWTSMGQEAEAEARRRAFEGYRLDAALLARAEPDALVMHCLPAHRGEEITAEVLDGPQSAVFDQAENRLHAQKALLLLLLGPEDGARGPT